MSDIGRVIDEVPVDHREVRVYAEGWQSWSPATWYAADEAVLRPDEEWQHLMRFRPGTPLLPDVVQAEGVLVVDPGPGSPARCYGASGPLEIPTLTASLHGDTVVVRADGPTTRTEDADAARALATYADELARTAGAGPGGRPPTVWCSWYRYFEAVTDADVREALTALDAHDLPVEVVLVDDGWSNGLGEGLRVRDRFGALPRLLDDVRATGRRPGLWLAPFLVGSRTSLALEHPDWLVGPAGHNWGDDLVGLDVTHPGVRDLLRRLLAELVELGVDYLKLDFLYGGAVPGRRHRDVTGTEAYRSGLELVRDVVGPEVHLVGCGAPLLPSVGLVDTMRVSPDTFHEGEENGSVPLRGLMPLAARAWQHGRLWVNDPDCVVARPTYSDRQAWADAALRLGGLRSFSDRVADLDPWGLRTVRALLADGGSARPFPDDVVNRAARTARSELGRLHAPPAEPS